MLEKYIKAVHAKSASPFAPLARVYVVELTRERPEEIIGGW